jgi:hypothetical protein
MFFSASSAAAAQSYTNWQMAQDERETSIMNVIRQKSGWAFDIGTVLNKLDPTFAFPSGTNTEEETLESDRHMSHWLLPLSNFTAYNPIPYYTPHEDDNEISNPSVPPLQLRSLETLAIDLSLSRTIFTNQRPVHPFVAPHDWHSATEEASDENRADTTLAKAASSLSLGSRTLELGDDSDALPDPVTELPTERTGFLRPVWAKPLADSDVGGENKRGSRRASSMRKTSEKRRSNRSEVESDAVGVGESEISHRDRSQGFRKLKLGQLTQPLGVRALLREWIVGEDPATYIFDPRYASSNSNSLKPEPYRQNTEARGRESQGRHPHSPSTQSRSMDLPPRLTAASSQPPPIVSKPRPSLGKPQLLSQMRDVQSLATQSQSQGLESWEYDDHSRKSTTVSTQGERGPFGGGLSAAKKVVLKKKKAGF